MQQSRNDIIEAIRSENQTRAAQKAQNANGSKVNPAVLSDIQNALSQIIAGIQVIPREDEILNRIWFSELGAREHNVEAAHKGTYRWLLYEPESAGGAVTDKNEDEKEYEKEDKERKQKRDAFLAWLSRDSGIFYISGKAGSGKSTLLKFLAHDNKTVSELEKWATSSGKKLIFARFFFWSSGTQLQKSLEGLYRSILWEVLRQCPSLLPDVFPDHWSSAGRETSSRFQQHTRPLEMVDLEAAIDRLFSSDRIFERHKVCLFIDGLDEYDGNYWKLAKKLSEWAVSSNDIKICLSSRPMNEFLHSFAGEPTRHFKLNDLTRQDMVLFASKEFHDHENYTTAGMEPDASARLIKSIVDRSDGVFLWVKLATYNILKGISGHCSIAQLEKRLEAVPAGLGGLFNQMMDAIDTCDKSRAAQMLLTMTNDLSLPEVSTWVSIQAVLDDLMDEDDLQLSKALLSGHLGPYLSSDECCKKCHSVSLRLEARCKGLVEVLQPQSYFPECHQLGFVHRTVRDFLHDAETQKKLQEMAGIFNPYEALALGLLATVKFIDYAEKICCPPITSPDLLPRTELQLIILVIVMIAVDAERAGHSPLVGQLESLTSMLKEIADLDSNSGVEFTHPRFTGQIGRGMRRGITQKKIRRENIESAIMSLYIAFGGTKFALDNIQNNPNLIQQALRGGHNFILAATFVAAKGTLKLPNPPIIQFIKQGSSSLNSQLTGSCIIRKKRGHKYEPYLPKPPWTTWTSFLLGLSTLIRGQESTSSGGYANQNYISKTAVVLINAFLQYGSDPSVCFVGYRIQKDSDDPDDSEPGPQLSYVTLLDMMKIWNISPLPSTRNILSHCTQDSTRTLLGQVLWLFGQDDGPKHGISYLDIHDVHCREFLVIKIFPSHQLDQIPLIEVGTTFKRLHKSRFEIVDIFV